MKRAHCDIKNCKDEILLGWCPRNRMDKALNICERHWKRHCNDDDSFSLWKIVGMKKPELIREELLDAGVEVTDLTVKGEIVVCQKCGYQGVLIVETSECPKCNGKLIPLKGAKSVQEYLFKIRCKSCGVVDRMSKQVDISKLLCSGCGRTGTTVHLKKGTMKMAKKKKTKVKKKVVTTKSSPKLSGKISGLGIFVTWVKAFVENHKKKASDEQSLSQMKKEFPDRAAKSKVFSNVSTHRRLYNSGFLTNGDAPKVASKKYK